MMPLLDLTSTEPICVGLEYPCATHDTEVEQGVQCKLPFRNAQHFGLGFGVWSRGITLDTGKIDLKTSECKKKLESDTAIAKFKNSITKPLCHDP
jgi:hypothetical protein